MLLWICNKIERQRSNCDFSETMAELREQPFRAWCFRRVKRAARWVVYTVETSELIDHAETH